MQLGYSKSTFSEYLKTGTNNYSVVCWPSSCSLLVFLLSGPLSRKKPKFLPFLCLKLGMLINLAMLSSVLRVSQRNQVSSMMSRTYFCKIQSADSNCLAHCFLCLGAVVGVYVHVWKALWYKTTLTGSSWHKEFPLGKECIKSSDGPFGCFSWSCFRLCYYIVIFL